MEIHQHENAAQLTSGFADWLVNYIKTTLLEKPRFTIALSGGNTPKQLFILLASDTYRNKIDWTRMHVFWGDERVVPFDDDRNNAKVAIEILLDKVPVPKEQVHRMQTDNPAGSASAYDTLLHTHFDGKQTSFDLVMLGLGEDGHTLSVFPGSPVLADHHSWVKAIFVIDQNMLRITLTPLIVNKAAAIAFLVSGESKAIILQKILHRDPAYPASLIDPKKGVLHWFVDKAANPRGY